jgi:hypothetical protein
MLRKLSEIIGGGFTIMDQILSHAQHLLDDEVEHNGTTYWLFSDFKKAHDAVVNYHYAVSMPYQGSSLEGYGDLKKRRKNGIHIKNVSYLI